MKRKDGKTRQGVRDLSYLPGKSKGIKLDPIPPEAQICKHTNTYSTPEGDTVCRDCGAMWDWDGKAW